MRVIDRRTTSSQIPKELPQYLGREILTRIRRVRHRLQATRTFFSCLSLELIPSSASGVVRRLSRRLARKSTIVPHEFTDSNFACDPDLTMMMIWGKM